MVKIHYYLMAKNWGAGLPRTYTHHVMAHTRRKDGNQPK